MQQKDVSRLYYLKRSLKILDLFLIKMQKNAVFSFAHIHACFNEILALKIPKL
jgi:hypothetical protein